MSVVGCVFAIHSVIVTEFPNEDSRKKIEDFA